MSAIAAGFSVSMSIFITAAVGIGISQIPAGSEALLCLQEARTFVPTFLVGCRMVIAAFLVYDASDGFTGWPWVLAYMAAVLSDIFDGVVARRTGTVSPYSAPTELLLLSVGYSTWMVYPEVLTAFGWPLLVAVFMQLSLFAIALIKFGRAPCFRTYVAKAWGLGLLIAVVALFGTGCTPLLWLPIVLCWLNSIEEIVMIFILPEWEHDVLTLVHALELRRQLLSAAQNVLPSPPTDYVGV